MASSSPERDRPDSAPRVAVQDGAAPRASVTEVTAESPHPAQAHRQETTTWSIPNRRTTNNKNNRGARKQARSSGVEWHEKWTKDSWKDGRVLLIDYVAPQHTSENRRKILAQEFSDVAGLERFYRNEDLSRQAAFRVIHVQNAPWATRFLLRKFNIDANDDLVGTTFGRWARYENPKKRGQGKNAKPIPTGKTFRAQRDPWRGISRAAFGLDYLRQYERQRVARTAMNEGMKMMELNHFDAMDNPTYGFDAYAQRLSVYVQLSESEDPSLLVDPNVKSPYKSTEEEEEELGNQRLRNRYTSSTANTVGSANERYVPKPKIENMDNGSTIILFEHSQSGTVNDTLIGARQEVEQRWRRLTFYLPREETSDDERLAIECMDFILRDIFRALAFNWERNIHACETHVSILEDKIYENPADESRAPELWTNSNLWLKVERLLYLHTNTVKEMQSHLREVAHEDPNDDDPWLANSAEELEKLTTQFQNGVVKPTANLSDLMYKSVEIRDAHHSLQLGLSMWRLSWITFIFLPLTFVVGFFGMNVDTFESNPSIKWWFITTVPLFAVVIISWYAIKHSLASQRQNPLRRGVYENLFYELSEHHPALWTRGGPKEGIIPVGWWNAIKWQLITKWFNPDRTIATKDHDPSTQELGWWSRTKRFLVRRWLDDMVVFPGTLVVATAEEWEAAKLAEQKAGAMGELVNVATPIAMAGVDPMAAAVMRHRDTQTQHTTVNVKMERSEAQIPVTGRTTEDGVSGVMIDEESGDEHYEGGSPDTT